MAGHQSSVETTGGAPGGSPLSLAGKSSNHRSGFRRFAGRVRRRLAPSRPPREGFGELDHLSLSGGPVQEPIDVFGWWLFPGGAARSGHLSINGEPIAPLAVHRPRTDVAATLSHLPDAGISGFACTWNPTLALAGRTIRLEIVLESPEGVMHAVAWRELVLAPGHRGSIESYPSRNGPHGISGWAFFDDGPVTRAWATWNGAPIAELEIGIPRSDVGQGYSSLPWASTSGFSGHLNLVGSGDLSVLLVRNDGRLVYMDSIHVQMPNAGTGAGAFECPQDGDLVDGEIVVKGWWAFTGGPPRGGFLYCDDQPVMPIDVHLERADIATRPRMLLYYPHIRTCGFACRWRPNREMVRGDHLLSIRLESPGGHETWLGPRRVRLGNPHRGEVRRWPSSASPVVEGWAIFEQGPVYRAFLCVNNERTIEIDTGLPTPDLLNDFSDKPWAAEAGFRGELKSDLDWSRAELSVLLVGQMGQQHILETRRPSEEAAGHCRIVGFGASFDPIMPPDADNAHLVVTGWAHRMGRRLDRLWLSTSDLPSWQCQVGIDRPDVTHRDAVGFRAFIPTDVLLCGGEWSDGELELTLHTDSGFGPIELVATSMSAGPCGTVGAGAFDMDWRHADGVLDVRIVPHEAESEMAAPRLLVDSIDVTERLRHETGSSPCWRYSLATSAYEGDSIELLLPDGGPDARSVIPLSQSETRSLKSSPSLNSSCVLLTAADGTEYAWIEQHSTCPASPEACVVDDMGRSLERGQLRRMTTPTDTRDYFVYVGLLPAADGSYVNIVNRGEDGRPIGATHRIGRTPIRLDASSSRDLSPATTDPRAPAVMLPDNNDELATCWLLLGPKARQQVTFDAVLEAARRTTSCNVKPVILADPAEQQGIQAVINAVADDDQLLEIMSFEEASSLRPRNVGDVILPFNRAGLRCIDPRGLGHLITALQCEGEVDAVYGDEFEQSCRDSRATPMQYKPFSTTAHLLGQVNYGGAIAFRFDAFDVSLWCAEGCDDTVVWEQVAKVAVETHRVRRVSTVVLGYEAISPRPTIAEDRIRNLLPESSRDIVLQRHAAGGFMPRAIGVEAEKVTIVVHNSHSLPVDVCGDVCKRYHDLAATHGFEIHLAGPCLPAARHGEDRITFHACGEDRIEAEIADVLDATAREFVFLIDFSASLPGDDWLAQWMAFFQLPRIGLVGLTALDRQGDCATQIWGLGGRQPVVVPNSATEAIADCLLPDTSLLGLRREMWTQVGGLDMSLPRRWRWIDLALSAQADGWRAIVSSPPVFEWSLRSCSALQTRAMPSPSATEIRKWRDLLQQYSVFDNPHRPVVQVADVEPIGGCSSIVPTAHPVHGRRVLFWIGSDQRATRIACVAQLAAHLNAKGWECRAVVSVGSDMHRAFKDRGILSTVSPNEDFASDRPDADHGPFHGWQPDLIHVFGSALRSATRAYPTPSAPIVLTVDDDSLLHSLTSDDPSVAIRLQVADRRVTAFLTSACTQYADLCQVFGENRVFLIENDTLASEKLTPTESLRLGGTGSPIVVFLEPHDSTQTTTFLSAVKHFEARGGSSPLFQVFPTSDPDNGASANTFDLAYRLLGAQARMNLMSADSDGSDLMRGTVCVTFLGPAESTAPEVATAISLGVWVITAPPCERIEADATSGQILERLHGSELANAWLRRPRGRAISETKLRFPSADTSALAIDRLYRRCLA